MHEDDVKTLHCIGETENDKRDLSGWLIVRAVSITIVALVETIRKEGVDLD